MGNRGSVYLKGTDVVDQMKAGLEDSLLKRNDLKFRHMWIIIMMKARMGHITCAGLRECTSAKIGKWWLDDDRYHSFARICMRYDNMSLFIDFHTQFALVYDVLSIIYLILEFGHRRSPMKILADLHKVEGWRSQLVQNYKRVWKCIFDIPGWGDAEVLSYLICSHKPEPSVMSYIICKLVKTTMCIDLERVLILMKNQWDCSADTIGQNQWRILWATIEAKNLTALRVFHKQWNLHNIPQEITDHARLDLNMRMYFTLIRADWEREIGLNLVESPPVEDNDPTLPGSNLMCCGICMEAWTSVVPHAFGGCGHVVCHRCIKRCKRQCPFCRMPSYSTIRLFFS